MKIIKYFSFKKHIRALLAALFFYSSFSISAFETINKAENEVWVTIFVHGIISIKPHITLSNFMRFLTDNICDSIYSETVDIMRDDPFFYQNQTIQARGLQPIDINNYQHGAAASLMANLFEKTNQINATHSAINYYYTFGWWGLLSRSARYYEAKEFLAQLEALVAQFRSQGIEPKIRIVGYSHGGTISLKLAMVKEREHIQPSFCLEELILIGTPIQYDTDYLIQDPFFKKVYNIFSRSDRIQKLDFFSCGQFFSEHVFIPHCGFELPDKLTQVEIRVVRKKGEACKPFLECDPIMCVLKREACTWRTVRNVSPGHTEMWFFGWTPMNFRKTFPLYPLPVVSVLPFILNAIKPLEPNFIPEKPIIVTLDPYRDAMIITNKLWCDCQIYEFPFVGIANLQSLKHFAFSYKPLPIQFNTQKFNEHISVAYEQALSIVKAKKCKHHVEHTIVYD